jgi:hypothetical protein
MIHGVWDGAEFDVVRKQNTGVETLYFKPLGTFGQYGPNINPYPGEYAFS